MRRWTTGVEEGLRSSGVDVYTPLMKTDEGSAGTANETMMLKIWHDAKMGHVLRSGARTTKMTTREAVGLSDASEKKTRGEADDYENGLKIPWLVAVQVRTKDKSCNYCSNLKNGNTSSIGRRKTLERMRSAVGY